MNLSELQHTPQPKLDFHCKNLRKFLIDSILKSGGHFSGNLGVVELTVALHYVFRSPHDKIIWDVGHQAYLHKALTHRWDDLTKIRTKNGISGFPKISESIHDAFGTGHSSTSISAILGYAIGAKLNGIKREHIAVIGDGSLTGGLAYEGLLNVANSKTNATLVINDNQMSIDAHEGTLAKMLNDIKTEDNFFTQMGFSYYGPLDGHNVNSLVENFKQIKNQEIPKIIHVKTIKGKGFKPAEQEKSKWHSVKYVKLNSSKKEQIGQPKFQDVFGKTLVELAKKNPKVLGITPAMPTGSSFHFMMDIFPNRCFDVGIAEQHAVTFAAGLALDGFIPFCGIYSSFLQRAYDQVIHDICLQNIPVIFCIDRAGIVGEDGPTHHGIFDISFLQCIPNIKIWCPKNAFELEQFLIEASKDRTSPIAIRYPKGHCNDTKNWPQNKQGNRVKKPSNKHNNTLVISTGILSVTIENLNQNGWDHLHLPKIKPLPIDFLFKISSAYDKILIFEEGSVIGGLGSEIQRQMISKKYTGTIIPFGIPDNFLAHGSRDEILESCHLDSKGILEAINSNI